MAPGGIFDHALDGMPRLNLYRAQVHPDLYTGEKPMLVDNWLEQGRILFGTGRRWKPAQPAPPDVVVDDDDTGISGELTVCVSTLKSAYDDLGAYFDADDVPDDEGADDPDNGVDELEDPGWEPLIPPRQDEAPSARRYRDDDPWAPGTDDYPDHQFRTDASDAIRQGQLGGSPNGWTDVQPEVERKRESLVWGDADRGRWRRTTGTDGEGGRRIGDPNLYSLHVDTDGGWAIDPEARVSREQLEVCRHCGADLALPRDEYGFAVREFKTQDQYCSDRCEDDADNRRDRQRRRGGKFPKDGHSWYVSPTTFDFEWITVSGVGTSQIPPADWNRLNPRNDPHSVKPRPGNHRDVFMLPLHEHIMQRRDGHRPHPKIHRWRDSLQRRYPLPPIRIQPFAWNITQQNGAVAC